MTDAALTSEDLRRRLDEAEDTIRAIRDGEVDALLVRGGDEDRVFHLGGEDSYRAFMEAMDVGAAALDEAGRLLYANTGLASLLGLSSAELQEAGLLAALGPSAAEVVRELASRASTTRDSAEAALTVAGEKRRVLVTGAPLPLGFSSGCALTFNDITQRVEAAAEEERERIGEAVMASTNEAVVVCNTEGVVTHANPAISNILDVSPVGRRFEEVISLAFPPGAGPMVADDLVAIALSGGSMRGLEATVLSEAKAKDLLISVAPLRHAAGAIGGCTIALVDLSSRKALEKRQSLLMRELDHRIKNMLALVLSISTRTANASTDLADFKARFGQRMAALAATQNLLSERTLEGLSIQELLGVELAPYLSVRSPRVSVEGLDVKVSRDAAVALGLVFHELVTNAVKYGALSMDSGRLTLSGVPAEGGALEITWRETGGPRMTAPTKIGFGQTVIARGLGHSAAEPTKVEFLPDGLSCRMVLAAEALV